MAFNEKSESLLDHNESAAAERRGALIELMVWLSLAGIALILSFEFANTVGAFRYGPAFFPWIAIGLMVAGALFQAFLRLTGHHSVSRDGRPMSAEGLFRPKALGMFSIPIFYLLLLPKVGFFVSTPLFLIAYLAYLGERRPTHLIGVPLFIYALLLLVFVKLFFVPVPTGQIEIFNAVSNAIISVLQ